MSAPPSPKLSVELAVTPAVTGLWIRTGRGNECVGLAVRDGVPRLEFCDEHAVYPPSVAAWPGEPTIFAFGELLEVLRCMPMIRPEGDD